MSNQSNESWSALAEMFGAFSDRIPFILAALCVFLVFFFVAKWLRSGIRHFADKRKRHRNLGIVLGRLIQGLVLLIGLLIGLVMVLPGFKPVQLVEFLGIGTIAVGFVFRDILQNFLAGILILLTEPFRIGDQIISGEFEGQVEEIETRATSIRTYDGRRIVVPNANLLTNPVTVNTAFDNRRLQYDVGIGVSDDIDRAKASILSAIRSVPDVLEDPAPDVLVVDLAASSVRIRARWWIQPPRRWEYLESQDRVLTAVKRRLAADGIDLPFTTQTILFHDQTEETDGNRARQREGWPAVHDQPPAPRTIAGALNSLAEAISRDGKPRLDKVSAENQPG